MPCCSVHGEWNATLLRAQVHRDLRRDLRPFGARRPRPDRARASAMRFALSAYGGSCAQQVAVVLDHDAAAAGGDDDRLGVALDVRPPGVDVARAMRATPRPAASGDTAARRSSRRRRRASARCRCGRARAPSRRRCRARAPAARSRRARASCARAAAPATRRPARGAGPCARERRAAAAASATRPSASAAPNSGRASRPAAQRPALRRLGRRARPTLLVDDVPADVDQPPVLDARRAGRLAAAAGEAAVEVQLRLRGRPSLPSSTCLIR